MTVEIFSRSAKLAKQMKLANSRGIPLVLLMGPDEISKSQVVIKDMETGNQNTIARNEVVATISRLLSSK
ncbi:MAG: histidyl-tRNA synthetase [bacterium ADurb.Bin400]|nr:MAG: histidyl-tRNA synthetase [bacterium ADurb.Bin400]